MTHFFYYMSDVHCFLFHCVKWPSSASAAENITFLIIWATFRMAPLLAEESIGHGDSTKVKRLDNPKVKFATGSYLVKLPLEDVFSTPSNDGGILNTDASSPEVADIDEITTAAKMSTRTTQKVYIPCLLSGERGVTRGGCRGYYHLQ